MFCKSEQMNMNWVGDWIGRRALISPKKIGLYDKGCEQKFSYQELNSRANKAGNFFISQNIAKGDRICIISRNRIEVIDLFFAAGKTGAVLAPISFRLAPPEISDLIDRIQPCALFYEEYFQETIDALELPNSIRISIKISDSDACEYKTNVLTCVDTETNTPLSLKETALLIHTGGTTSIPKICEISHQQMLWNSVELAATSSGKICATDEILTLPFFHIGGWNIFIPLIHFGGYGVLIRNFDPKEVLELIENEKIKIVPLAPAMVLMLTNHPDFDSYSFESVEMVFTGGAKCQQKFMSPFWEKNVPTAQSYGLTEAGPSNFLFIPHDNDMDLVKEKSDTVGQAMFHCDHRIVSDKGEELEPGNVGILHLKSLHSFEGYFNDDERTKKIKTNTDWIVTGDLAIADDDGFVTIIGRADNMFISGAENISPEEIEGALLKHPKIEEAVCIGVDDEKWGQIPIAKVIITDECNINESELIDFSRQYLAKFKLPKRIYFVDTIPKTGAGKLDRNAVIQEHKK